MEWTVEAVKAEVDRRHAAARHDALILQVRAAGGPRPRWWHRLFSTVDRGKGKRERATPGKVLRPRSGPTTAP